MWDGLGGGLSGKRGGDCGVELRLQGRGSFCVIYLKRKKNCGLELVQEGQPEYKAKEEKSELLDLSNFRETHENEERIVHEKAKLWFDRCYDNNTTSTTTWNNGITKPQQWDEKFNSDRLEMSGVTCFNVAGWAACRDLQTSTLPVCGGKYSYTSIKVGHSGTSVYLHLGKDWLWLPIQWRHYETKVNNFNQEPTVHNVRAYTIYTCMLYVDIDTLDT